MNHPLLQAQAAIAALSTVQEIRLVNTSSYYQTKPWGIVDQPDFINAVAAIDTALSPGQLLKQLQAIEQAQGRKRLERWGPRTIDLDILLYGDRVVSTDDLTIPHPRLTEREFVLYPLAELAPDLKLPTGEAVVVLASQCPRRGLAQLPNKDGKIGA